MFAQMYFVMDVAGLPIAELVRWLHGAATLQESHPFHGTTWPDWTPGAKRFREHACALTGGLEAAKNRDRQKARELEQEHADTLESIHLNANYIAMRSVYEKNEALRHNVGYILKEQTKKSNNMVPIRTTPMVLKVKKGDKNGSVVVRFEKDPGAGLYHLQICKGQPVGEESWGEGGLHKSCRVILYDLELASWYFFRGRSHGDNETGPWSDSVGIIVT